MPTAPLRFGILTISDRSARGERPDLSGPALEKVVLAQKGQILWREIVPDDDSQLCDILRTRADAGDIDILLTTGGTGFAPRDITPEATRAVVERLAPGLPEAMRAASLDITPFALLSRGVAGIRARTLIINLPGSPKGAVEHLEVVLPVLAHAVQLLRDDPNAEAGHTPPASR